MKEITVTFENGGVFNGSANSFTLNNLITYYFTIDKNYRVQVNANTMAIELQEYQNTNGAWYGIDIITAVSVQEVQAIGDVTKEYLEENYYNKTEVDAKISAIPSSDVTKEWIAQNYYSKPQIDQRLTAYWSKTEADGRFVLKTGDTMTGALNINNAYLNILNARGKTVVSLRQSPSNYGGFINIYDGSGNEEYTIQLSGGNHNMRIRNDYNNGNGVYLDGDGKLFLYEPATLSRYFIIQPYGVFFNGAGGDYTTWQPSGLWFQKNGKNIMTFVNNRLDLYNNGSVYLHTGEADTTEQYMVLTASQFITYNRATTWGLTIQTGGVRFQGGVDMEAQGSRVSVSGASNVILGTSSKAFTVNNYSTAMQGNFYGGDSFINALNLFLARVQDAIKSAVPSYQTVSEIPFGSESFGGGFQAGGGTSRGGGIGRR